MSCSNHHPNFSRKPKISVRQLWKRKTPLPKSSPTCHNDSPPPPLTNTPHSISPPMNYPQRDRIINQLHTISTLIDSQTPTPPSSPHLLVPPSTNAQVGCHASFCHCCRDTTVAMLSDSRNTNIAAKLVSMEAFEVKEVRERVLAYTLIRSMEYVGEGLIFGRIVP
ncbi:hypothetical protein Tco_0852086 [Tanacetum coccineum]